MADIRIRKRRRLRTKDIKVFADGMEEAFGMEVLTAEDAVDIAEAPELQLLFVNGSILGMVYEGKAFLTVRGLLKYRPERRAVTVDMGAVPFVSKGADVMAPGIVEADEGIREGDLVWIRDITHRVPLAIGQALMSGTEMVSGDSGKAIKSIHYVGDKLWKHEES
jgi:PUA-domain protein